MVAPNDKKAVAVLSIFYSHLEVYLLSYPPLPSTSSLADPKTPRLASSKCSMSVKGLGSCWKVIHLSRLRPCCNGGIGNDRQDGNEGIERDSSWPIRHSPSLKVSKDSNHCK